VSASSPLAHSPPAASPTKPQGKVKQIVGSTLKDLPAGDAAAPSSSSSSSGSAAAAAPALQTNFVSDKPSSWYAQLYQSDKLTGGHVIMLGADDASVAAAKGALGAWPGGLQLGGGVTSDNAAGWLDAGASHVIVTSYVFREGRLEEDRLKDLVS
jgi:phosphoribosylformimino-5-aminoimidazole carboxamide ribotide isomerase